MYKECMKFHTWRLLSNLKTLQNRLKCFAYYICKVCKNDIYYSSVGIADYLQIEQETIFNTLYDS